MNLENSIEKTVMEFLKGGNVEKKVEEKLGEAVDKTLADLFGYSGTLKKLLEEQINAALVPVIEGHDFSDYVTKLEPVLIKVLQEISFENNKILKNFKELAAPSSPKEIKVTEVFEQWCKHVAAKIDTSDLEVEFDDEPRYEYVECTFEIEIDDDRSWSSFEHGIIRFECEKDENLNVEFRISKWSGNDKNWNIHLNGVETISSLRTLSDFDVYMMNLSNCRTELIVDEQSGENEVEPEEEPEATFS